MSELVHVGPHAAILASGRPVGPGDHVNSDDLDTEDQHLLDEGHLVAVDSFAGASNVPAGSGDDLKARARELDVKGRSTMSADELREAVAQAETDTTTQEG